MGNYYCKNCGVPQTYYTEANSDRPSCRHSEGSEELLMGRHKYHFVYLFTHF